MQIKSPRFEDAPAIAPNYLSTAQDRKIAADSLRVTRRIVAQPALARFQPQEYKPGVQFQSDEELAKLAGDIATTIFHPVGTTRMGRADDPMAVVDARLRVHDGQGGLVAGLRVVDAGVMPYTSFMALYDAGAPVKIVAGGGIEGCVLVAQPGLDSPEKLKGKTLGTFQLDTLEVLPYDWLKKNGVAFKDINPGAPVHVLLVPRKPIPRLCDATIEDQALLGHLMLTAGKIAEQLGCGDAFRLAVNNGAGAGQSVFHLHLHILGGRSLSWPPG